MRVSSHILTIVKALTWRTVAAADTFLLTYLVTGKFTFAFGIVGFELFTKTAMFYGHDRIWTAITAVAGTEGS